MKRSDKMFKTLKTITAVFAVLLLAAGTTPVFAAPSPQEMACEQTYSVQADDWLSKLADKFYGDIQTYPAIVSATNAIAQTDSEYATIDNPDLIEIGWVLCIPSAADAQATMDGMMMDDGTMLDDGTMVDEGAMMDDGTMTDDGQMMDDGTVSDDHETMDDGSMSDDGGMMDGEGTMDDGSTSDDGTMGSSDN